MAPEVKVYEVKVAFEVAGLIYEVGQKYELSTEVVANLAEGTVVEFVPETIPTADDSSVAPAGETPVAETADATPAEPWVGSHTVGRE